MHADSINQLGFQFDSGFNVEGRFSISDLFPKSKPRCGIYLLGFSNQTFYIGQAIDAVRRFSQHRKTYSDIISYWFQEVEKSQLDSVEQRLIREGENYGLLLTNKTFVSNVIGEADLDFIISKEEQNIWLQDTTSEIFSANLLYQTIAEKFKLKYRQKFITLTQLVTYEQTQDLLKIYTEFALPKPTITQLSFWSLSCLPATNNRYKRYFCLNVNAMDVFVVGEEKKSKKEFGFFVASSSLLNDNYIRTIRKKYPSLEIYNRNYRAAGTDQLTLDFTSLYEMQKCLRDELIVRQAIKHLNLRLMRKGGTIYSPYHCFDLANQILK
ncbi:hypothetical protein GCM10027422_35820 [Hymenobacter arcticus]